MGILVGRVRPDPKFNFTPPGGNTTATLYKATFTCMANPSDGDTLFITYDSGDITFTFKDTPSTELQVGIGATAADTMNNLATKMTAVAGDADWVSVRVSTTKGAGATVAVILTEAFSSVFTGVGSMAQSESLPVSYNVNHRRYCEAVVEDADGNSNGMLWVKVVEDVSGGGSSTVEREVVIISGTVGIGGTAVDLSDNTGGGILRFINTDGSAPSGYLAVTEAGYGTGMPLLPKESFIIDASIKTLYIKGSTAGQPYVISYLKTTV